ncbi:hypothetical protein H5410_001991 [Solanum commersonii]|uniref:Uncharacterized protein n=1 Tax=Solanum commersonii TaxID=4109 RepID=A0A9J6B138_SOLCO|nr:hypothetical protein H5410_001991 [Solanum commersonii]
MLNLYPRIILGTPFINVIYPFTNINAKGFSATYKNQDISYTFITEPISRYINALFEMKQKHIDYLQLEVFSMNILDTFKPTKVQEKIKLISEQMAIDICVDHPSAFWNRKKHVTNSLTDLVKTIKERVKSLPCLTLANPAWQKIVETDASTMGYDDLYNKKFVIKTDAQSAKYMFSKDFKHDVSKFMFARWQAQLAPFDFEILYKKGGDNSLPDFLSREYIQNE